MTTNNTLELIECPRDAMQGWSDFIPTKKKVEYLNALLGVGFDVLDFGSFVSHKAIPQMADTKDVLPQLNLSNTDTKLLAIIVNTRGGEEAIAYDQISYLGYPFSISETFQVRNTNKSISESLTQVEEIQNLCVKNGKELIIYISMAFGNNYGDDYNADIVINWVGKLVNMGVKTMAMADTIGKAEKEDISYIFNMLLPEFKEIKFGAHLHSKSISVEEKITAAYIAGCRRFDSAILGIGGCPMAEDKLVGNVATESIISWCKVNDVSLKLDLEAFSKAEKIAHRLFKKS
jgi:hydroxymethylglutaryl-CoA lyase